MCKAQATVRNEVSSLYTRARMSHRKFWWKSPELPVKQDQTVGLVSQLGSIGTSGARTGTFGPYRNLRMEPGTILLHANARANCTNRNFRCLIGTFGKYRNFQTETEIKYSHAGASDRNFWCSSPELPVQLTRTFGPSLQPTKLRQEHFLSLFCQLDLYLS
jgi:hypothetical protein